MVGKTVGHYRILEKIGEGGMGEVFLAEDTELDRKVALKVLPESMAESQERLERFRREAKAVAALNHPNIVTIHSIEEIEGRRLLTMEWVEGESLDRMIGHGGLSMSEIFAVAIQLSDALAAAHEKGIVHRDLKPANVMVTRDGRVKVLDFGLAKLAAETAESRAESLPTQAATETAGLTAEGVVMGTAPYMSPEQLEGREVDLRTDIFSLGVVLYEMATGRRPFEGGSRIALASSILKDSPAPVTAVRTELPRHLGRIIQHCLEKDPEHRLQSAKDVRNELRSLRKELETGEITAAGAQLEPSRGVSTPAGATPTARSSRWGLWAGSVAIVAVIAAAGFWFGRSASQHKVPTTDSSVPAAALSAPQAASPSIAVLPFADLSPQKDQEYFTDGLTEEMLNVLAQIRGLRVAARTSSFAFKGQTPGIAEVGAKLNVGAILEGSVRKADKRVRITAQLISVEDGFHLWSETYDRELDDIFQVQEEIATAVVGALKVTLLGEEAEAFGPGTSSTEAYNAYLQGRFFSDRRSEEDLERAADYFDQALELDPDFALAWTGLAEVRYRQAAWGVLPFEDGFEAAREAAARGLGLNDKLAEAHLIMGQIIQTYDWEWAAADAALQRALQLKPGDVRVLLGVAAQALDLGRFEESLELARRMVALDPLSVPAFYHLGHVAYHAGEFEQAEAALLKALDLNPEQPLVHLVLAHVYLQQSRPEEALTVAKREPLEWGRSFMLALVFHELGRHEEAEASLQKITDEMGDLAAYQIAVIYAAWGEIDRAFEWLDKAYALRDPGLPHLKADQHFENLHSDSRWTALIEKMNLAD